MDAAGKDSAIKAVFEGVNPQGCEVSSFKQPSTRNSTTISCGAAWSRCRSAAASASSTVPITRNAWWCGCTRRFLAKQKIPQRLVTKNIWRERFEDITAVERYLSRNGIVILKFFLNVSKQEQRQRFLDRLEEPAKNWKFSMADVAERALWPRYMAAYQDMIRHTSTRSAPWHVVPSDHKWFARVVIGSTIVAALDRLDLHFPKVDKADRSEFATVREALLKEGKGDEKGGARKKTMKE